MNVAPKGYNRKLFSSDLPRSSTIFRIVAKDIEIKLIFGSFIKTINKIA